MKRSCCIVSDNGQRITKKENEKTDSMDIKKTKEKLNSTYKKLKSVLLEKLHNISDSGKKYIKAGVGAAAILVAGVVISANFTPVYSVYLGDEFVGKVTSVEAFETAYNNANETIAELDSPYGKLAFIPDYIYGIAYRGALTGEYELESNIINLSKRVRPACYINIDGNNVLCVADETSAKTVLENIKLSYGGEQAEIVSEVVLTNGFANVKSILDESIAQTNLVFAVKVQTSETVVYDESVPFGVDYVDNGELYKGQTNPVSDGVNGTRSVTAKVTKINGIEIAREEVSSNITVMATNQVVQRGTKEPTGIGSGSFIDPTFGTITSRFGSRWGGRHDGLDIANKIGTPVEAADCGVIITAEYHDEFGNYIIIDHNNGYVTYYAHLDKIDVAVGDKVIQGQYIGTVGNTGYSTGPHLHFEVRKNGVPTDPLKYLN